jgi:hypothetical protein
VLIEWAWAYVTFQRGARLIPGPAAYTPPGAVAARAVAPVAEATLAPSSSPSPPS